MGVGNPYKRDVCGSKVFGRVSTFAWDLTLWTVTIWTVCGLTGRGACEHQRVFRSPPVVKTTWTATPCKSRYLGPV
ncbi:unnamed protein product [Microthlaspi erraticum]|uniref:Uncharacterized protein n=1 Tax=Microthlaspi erraticum TaxID=1685480 RepID=A0A6D2JJQ0_9BRAS|nr:unnamed protein product [Microthlaspi erraticum]